MDDYIDFVLGRNQSRKDEGTAKAQDKPLKKSGTIARDELKALRRKVTEAETAMKRLQVQLGTLDAALADPGAAKGDLQGLAIGTIGKRHTQVSAALEEAEMAWLEASEALDAVMSNG